MAPKLSDFLINEGLISPAQLEEALKCQVIFGGRLGTNLVEMNIVTESDVVRCLSKQLERPSVSPEQLMSVSPDIIALIPKEIAEEYKIVPLSLEKRRLTVAMMNPSDLAAIDKISFITGYIIVPVVCSELRLLHALEQYYEIKRELRFIRLSGETRSWSTEAVLSDFDTGEAVISLDWLDRKASTGPVVTTQVQGAGGDWGVELNRALLPDQSDNDPGLLDISLDEEEILTLEEPAPQDEIAASIADYIYQHAERVALFMVQGSTATGQKAHSRKKGVEGFENFQLALDESSVLKVVADTRSLYFGPLLDTAGNRRLLAAFGGGTPESALLLPLMMLGKVVMIFYLDCGKELAKDLESLQNSADMAGLASEILQYLLFQ
jgi:hypothetical protein